MSDPSLAIQKVIIDRLRGYPPLAAIVGDRIYDAVPSNPSKQTMPYVVLGSTQIVEDGAECIDANEVFIDIHVYDRHVGKTIVKQAGSAIRKSLHEAELLLGTGYGFLEILHRDTRYLEEPDGATAHGVVTFRALVDNA